MVFDLVAGAKQQGFPWAAGPATTRPARILVFDSGLGGLTVYPEVERIASGAAFCYAADDAVFPYGGLGEQALVARVLAVMSALVDDHSPDLVVIACHTASTLVLPPLRARWPEIAFVGTVPAIKPAAAASKSRRFSVLATPGTVAREYTRDLVTAYAGDCDVTLVGATHLAALAEAVMRGDAVDDCAVMREVTPAFVDDGDRRTDVIVMACTHYPLLLPRLTALAPWPVTWIDPAPAIARRVEQVLEAGGIQRQSRSGLAPAVFTSNNPPRPALEAFLARCGLAWQASPALAALGSVRAPA